MATQLCHYLRNQNKTGMLNNNSFKKTKSNLPAMCSKLECGGGGGRPSPEVITLPPGAFIIDIKLFDKAELPFNAESPAPPTPSVNNTKYLLIPLPMEVPLLC